jgi:hypothetical protein
MGMFAETEIIDYCLSFAEQGKQTSVFCFQQQTEVCHFRFQQTNGCLPFLFPSTNGSPFLFFICSKLTEVALYFEFRFCLQNSGNMEMGGMAAFTGVYISVRKQYLFPPPLLKIIFFPSHDILFLTPIVALLP